MASYRDEYYTKVDSLFETLRKDPFKTPIADPTEQEIERPGSIQPVGWVRNADEADGTTTVTIDNEGITIVDGRISVTNGSGTVVIDGTSNMFKIAASGTLEHTVTAGAQAISDVDLSLGFTYAPAFIAYLSSTTASTDAKRLGYFDFGNEAYVSDTSGGAVTSRMIAIRALAWVQTLLNGTNTTRVTLASQNENTANRTDATKYYILKEAAI